MEHPSHLGRTRRLLGEILSQMLNVPVLSAILLIVLYINLPASEPNRLSGFIQAMFFLSVLPAASLLFYIPGKTRDRAVIVRRQRIASFVFMIVSYPLGMIFLHQLQAPVIFQAIAVTYTLVTVGLILFNLVLRYKASGHAAGVAGPVTALIYLYGLVAAPLIALLPLVTWARMAAKGHNLWQTVVGAGLSLAIGIGVLWAYGFTPFTGILY